MVDIPPEIQQAPEEYGQAIEPLFWGIVTFFVVYAIGGCSSCRGSCG
jgi:hypothetical protein